MEPDDGVRTAYAASLVIAGGMVAVLLALPWHRYAISVAGAGSFALNRSGIQTPDAGAGRAALVLAVLLGCYAAAALAGPAWIAEPLRRADAWMRRGGIALFLVIGYKLLADTTFLGVGAWIALALGAVVVGIGRRLRPTPPGGRVAGMGEAG